MSSVDPVQLISKPDSCSQGKAFILLGVFFGFFYKPVTLKRELCSKSSGTAVEGTSSYGNTNKVSTRQHKPSVIREETITHFKLLIQSCSVSWVSDQCLKWRRKLWCFTGKVFSAEDWLCWKMMFWVYFGLCSYADTVSGVTELPFTPSFSGSCYKYTLCSVDGIAIKFILMKLIKNFKGWML